MPKPIHCSLAEVNIWQNRGEEKGKVGEEKGREEKGGEGGEEKGGAEREGGGGRGGVLNLDSPTAPNFDMLVQKNFTTKSKRKTTVLNNNSHKQIFFYEATVFNIRSHFKPATVWLTFAIHTKKDKIMLNLIKIYCILAQSMEFLVR